MIRSILFGLYCEALGAYWLLTEPLRETGLIMAGSLLLFGFAATVVAA